VPDSAAPFAGAKAGAVGAAFFTAVVGLFNYALLEALKSRSLADLAKIASCTSALATPEGCFSKIVSTYIPYVVLLPSATLGVLFGVLYGMYFEYIPGKGYAIRAIGLSLIFLIILILIGAAGNYTSTDEPELATIRAFDTVAMVVYAYVISKLYRRQTREVHFESPNPDKLKILVDGRNYTDKMRTLSLHAHKLKTMTDKGGVFHQWLVSGGVTVEDPRNPETRMRVEGDGLLKVS
jgi:hypothetical protein